MTTILAIETSNEFASAALLRDGKLSFIDIPSAETHSEASLPAMQRLLGDAGIALQDCDAIAFGCGPGAFTGVRTACGLVQGMAYGADLPVVPVVTLEAMALAAAAQHGDADFLCLLDARMKEMYAAVCRVRNQTVTVMIAPVLTAIDAALLSDWLAQYPSLVLALGPGLDVPEAAASCPLVHARPHAADVARIGSQRFLSGQTVSAAEAEPLYLRNKIALTTAERALQGRP